MAAITHVIFDFDGVLIDSEQVYSEAVRTLLRMAGLEGRVTPAEYTEAYDVELDRALCECPELPAASKLIDHFHAHGIPLAICTGSDAKEFEIKTDKCYRHWLEKIPLQVLCGSDPEVTHGKPSPIPYQVTMRRMEQPPASPAHVLVFEDSLNGARSAVAAGTRCGSFFRSFGRMIPLFSVMIPQPQFLDEAGKKQVDELRPQLAEVLNSLEEFDPTKYGLPPF
ncbi:HAD hydrolase, family IA, variant 3 [Aphelenchoides fujianensis]|nr:HAD hydrolase, family IA, variant 3 [Aphelenchoides fujianensis]